MMITVHLSDGRKITKDKDKLHWFTATGCLSMGALPLVEEGFITINLDNVLDMRPAEQDEIEHATIHGW